MDFPTHKINKLYIQQTKMSSQYHETVSCWTNHFVYEFTVLIVGQIIKFLSMSSQN